MTVPAAVWGKRLFTALALAPVGALALTQPVEAQEPPDPVVVAVHEVAPFVEVDADGDLVGFSIDLMRAIAEKAGVGVEFVVVDNVGAQLDAVESGDVDAGIGAISITAERETRVDFSQPIFDSGIQIAIRDTSHVSVLDGWAKKLRDPTLLTLLLAAVIGMTIFGTLMWRLERHQNPEFALPAKRGVRDGMWWATETMFSATYGDKAPRRDRTRLLAAAWMLTSMLLVAGLIAELTANTTVERLESDIQGVGDLFGKSVVSVPGTTSAAFLAQNGIQAELMESSTDAFGAVVDGSADAFVYDSALLRYLIARSDSDVTIAGAVLRAESYGIAVAVGSGLLEPINRGLLRVRETGTYDRLVAAYFG